MRARENPDSFCSIVNANTCRDPVTSIDRNCKISLMGFMVIFYHTRELELPYSARQYGDTYKSAAKPCHEIHCSRGHLFCGHNQIPLVLAICIVRHYHHATLTDIVNNCRNRVAPSPG